MSLQAAAQLLADKGRGPDSTLVHMSPREVKSLQDLAMAHGGSLSINPSTGLPEAGFLDNLLPMIIGGAAVGLSGGSVTPLMAGLGVGGLQALRSGDLGKGIMAGLGAYGGAGLMGGFMGAGAEAAANAAVPNVTAETAPQFMAAKQAALADKPFSMALEGAKSIGNQGISTGLTNLGSNITTGFGSPNMKLATTAAAAAAPVLMSSADRSQQFKPGEPTQVPVYDFAPNPVAPTPQPDVPRPIDYRNFVPGQTVSPQSQRSGVEQRYFNPAYTQTGTRTFYPETPAEKEDGGFLGLFAAGGPVEAMSEANTIGANTGYPQSGITQPYYATGSQTPYSQNMVAGAADIGVNPITGQMAFAEGGYTYDPKTQTYNQLAVETPTIAGSAKESGGKANSGSLLMGGSGEKTGPSAWESMSPAQQAAFYAANPTYAAVTQALQAAFGFTTPGMLQTALAPGFVADQASIARGIDPATGLQATDPAGPTGLYGDAAAGMNAPGPESMGFGIEGGSYGGGSTDSGGFSSGSGEGEAKGGVIRGISHLGDYSDGGRLLRGPGDGVSDDIPAMIGKRQPARLADGEFVVPARIVSELGNGSTEAGARKLYAMMDRIQAGRKKTMGRGKQFAKDSKADRHLPA